MSRCPRGRQKNKDVRKRGNNTGNFQLVGRPPAPSRLLLCPRLFLYTSQGTERVMWKRKQAKMLDCGKREDEVFAREARAAARLPNMMSGSQAVTTKTACLNTLSSVLFTAPHRRLWSSQTPRRALSALVGRFHAWSALPGNTKQPTNHHLKKQNKKTH